MTAPDQPAPPAPTPTMAAIARLERLQSSLSEWDFTDEDTDALDLALSAMRAVEALERLANGVPVEVDAFTGMRTPEDDAVFLTRHYCDPSDSATMCDREGCKWSKVLDMKAQRIGQGRTLIEAIEAAAAFPSPDGGSAK